MHVLAVQGHCSQRLQSKKMELARRQGNYVTSARPGRAAPRQGSISPWQLSTHGTLYPAPKRLNNSDFVTLEFGEGENTLAAQATLMTVGVDHRDDERYKQVDCKL